MKDDRDVLKKWVETWKTAGIELEKIRLDELRAFDYEKNSELIDSMLQYACEHAKVRLTSGLVEQQRFFKKLWEKIKDNKDLP